MLSKRIVAVLTLNHGVLTRTKRFKPDYRYTQSQIDLWEVDEVVILDITRGGDPDFLSSAAAIADEAFVPITLGGGIRELDDVKRYFDAGADKIAVNTAGIDNSQIITDIATKWGNQAVVASVDSKDGMVMYAQGTTQTGMEVKEWCRKAALLGAGEILLQPVDKDGSLMGYDLGLLREISGAVSVPVIICGGAGSWKHFQEGFEAGADGCATTNIYHFTNNGINSCKAYLNQRGIKVRISKPLPALTPAWEAPDFREK